MMTPIDRVPLDEFYVVPEAPRVIPPPEVRDVLGRGAGSRGDHHLLRGGATYRLDVRGEPPEAGPPVLSPVVMQFTVPSGGWVIDGDRVAKGSLDVYPDVAAIRVLRIDEVGTGSCDRLQRRFVNPGPTPMDLANAIAQSYPFDVLQPARPVQAFGHSGVHITLQLAATVDPQRCLDFNLRTYRSMTWFSEIVELWILDVDGTRVVVDRSWFSRTSDWVQQQQQAIVETIRFVAP